MSGSSNVIDPLKPMPIVLIESNWDSLSGFGTGFLIGENNDVITATHVIYSQKYGLADRIKVFPSYDSDLKGRYAHYPVVANYFDNIDPDGDKIIAAGDFRYETEVGAEADIALLTMEVDLVNQFGSFPVDWDFESGPITIKGYSKGNEKELDIMHGYAKKDFVDNLLIMSGLALNPGNSGSPVLRKESHEDFVIGIVSTAGWMTSLSGHRKWLENAIVENDIHLRNIDINIQISSSKKSVKEGSEVEFTIQSNLPEGSKIPYTIHGLDSTDIEVINVEGFVSSNQNGESILKIKILADEKTEGNEILTLKIEQSSLDVNVLDSSISYTDQVIIRLYLAIFLRKPNLEEISFHHELLSTYDYAMSDIANNFIESPEFKETHGEITSDELLVEFLYETVLKREPSKYELNFYRVKLELGEMERGEAVLNFSESYEYTNLLNPFLYEDGWI
ncbi:DUF4214 domain-containing protein [Betaproteobacteria bacterium]|nr:DUF4214 domain-containing protein [Betaproteobacteria bacterium]